MSGRTAQVMRKALKRWRDVNAERDQIILEALAAGIPQREITRISGISRMTIGKIVRKEQERKWAHLQPSARAENLTCVGQASNSPNG